MQCYHIISIKKWSYHSTTIYWTLSSHSITFGDINLVVRVLRLNFLGFCLSLCFVSLYPLGMRASGICHFPFQLALLQFHPWCSKWYSFLFINRWAIFYYVWIIILFLCFIIDMWLKYCEKYCCWNLVVTIFVQLKVIPSKIIHNKFFLWSTKEMFNFIHFNHYIILYG